MKLLRKFLLGIIIAILLLGNITPGFCAASNVPESSEYGMVDVGEFGTWATENNRKRFVSDLTYDIEQFSGIQSSQKQLVEDYVPIEAKIGMAFMNAFSHVGNVLDSSLVRFTIIFIIMMYGFWVMFEAYTIIIGQNTVNDKLPSIIKKAVMVGAWVAVLSIGVSETFMLVVSPIMYIGTLLSDMILNAVSSVVGLNLPDTCGAIHKYVASHISDTNIIDPVSASNIMCLPSRMSGFFRTAVSLGWQWVLYGIGHSAFVFCVGFALIGSFIYLMWKFAFVAFGVIADLFLGIMMLPFTAIAETVENTSYKGIAGNIFNGFVKLFSTEKLKKQIERFIDAALHFITMSIIISVCIGLLSTVYSVDSETIVPDIDNPSFTIVLLTTALAVWLAKNASVKATEIGGKISTDLGDSLQKDIGTLWKSTKDGVKKLVEIIKDEKK